MAHVGCHNLFRRIIRRDAANDERRAVTTDTRCIQVSVCVARVGLMHIDGGHHALVVTHTHDVAGACFLRRAVHRGALTRPIVTVYRQIVRVWKDNVNVIAAAVKGISVCIQMQSNFIESCQYLYA